jgi:hypothetical protein
MRPLLLILHLTLGVYRADAQIPALIPYTITSEVDQVADGDHDVVIRWYDRAAGSTPVASEVHRVAFMDGTCRVLLGATTPLPTDLLEAGTVWLGISVDGMPEWSPRSALLPVPFARAAAHAALADGLSAEATGIVTSFNEIGGAVNLVARDGITLDRSGNVLTLRFAGRPVTHGSIRGDGRTFSFSIRPPEPIGPGDVVQVHVESPGTTILATATIDPTTNSITIETAAPLLSSETLRWTLLR